MLTREIRPDIGDILLNGTSVWESSRQNHYDKARLSCCLQFDSLNEYMTAKEHLDLYLALRNGNLSKSERDIIVNESIEKMGLDRHANK